MMSRLASRCIVASAPLPRLPSAEQIMAMPAELSRRWTARQVRDLIAAAPLATPRYELVDGELLVTPSPALPHQVVVTRLLVALVAYLDREGIGVAIPSPSDVARAGVRDAAGHLRGPEGRVATGDEGGSPNTRADARP